MRSTEFARLLRAIAAVVERSNSSEIDALIRAMLGSDGTKVTPRPNKQQRGRPSRIADLSLIARRILDANDRAGAKSILEEERLTRRELVKLGQEHNVHIIKEDTTEIIEDKIVEALVGSRLSSDAIRGGY